MNTREIYTAESVACGHPDKFCDLVSDMVLDECLKIDLNSRVACEVYATKGLIVVGGEIITKAQLDYKAIVQEACTKVGYDLDDTNLIVTVREQSIDIGSAVSGITDSGFQGAGDQGIMIGYACDDTLDYLPLEYAYARKITDRLEKLYNNGYIKGIRLDAKSQVSAEFIRGSFERFTKIVISVQHDEDKDIDKLKQEIKEKVIDYVFSDFDLSKTEILINPSGRFVIGGIDADTGLTGRKIVVDAYGPRIPVGGGAYSGKDPSKVDRSGAYLARYIAKNIVAAELCEKCEVAISYAIGRPYPTTLDIDTQYTARVSESLILNAVMKVFDLSVGGMVEKLELKNPIYKQTANGGHFGKDNFAWERIDKAQQLKDVLY